VTAVAAKRSRTVSISTPTDPVPRFGHHHKLRVGLLGGSFNPAHQGHRQLAALALRRLRLDQVWLMVSPGNPLKKAKGMAPMAERLASARGIADGRRVIATAIESRIGTRYTADTLAALRIRFPAVQFVWLMGADILAELPRWRHWLRVAHTVPLAVVPRPRYNHRALAGQAAHRLRGAWRKPRTAPVLAQQTRPAWTFLPAPQNAISATALRAAYSAKRPPQEQDDSQKAHRRARPEARRQAPRPQTGDGPAGGREGTRHAPQESGGRRPQTARPA
jgi:nicotinate-nucleotide adenylyltransferase